MDSFCWSHLLIYHEKPEFDFTLHCNCRTSGTNRAKFILGPFFKLTVFGFYVLYVGLIIKAYFDSDFEFPVIKSILWLIVLYIWMNHNFALVWVGFVGFYIIRVNGFRLKKFFWIGGKIRGNNFNRNSVLLFSKIWKTENFGFNRF